MDPLTQILMQRQMGGQAPQGPPQAGGPSLSPLAGLGMGAGQAAARMGIPAPPQPGQPPPQAGALGLGAGQAIPGVGGIGTGQAAPGVAGGIGADGVGAGQALGNAGDIGQGQAVPSVPPSGGQTNTPPQAQRYANAQGMMDAYRNNWNPNPVLLDATQR